MSQGMARVLAADVPEADATLRDCLPGHELVFVRNLPQALRALRHDSFHMILIGMHFDESRMFDLLQYVRAMPTCKDVPIICVQCLEVGLPDAVLKNIDDAVKALGGTAFVDLREHALYFRSHCELLGRVATAIRA